MREVQIFHAASESDRPAMIGAIWVRGRIEIDENGVVVYGQPILRAAQLCLTLPGKVSYKVNAL